MADRGSTESTLLSRRPKQQYFFLYGSTDDRPGQADARLGAPSPSGTDQESLVGEDLVTTDNEQDISPNTSERDFQQMIMTNGNQVHTIENGVKRPKTCFQFLGGGQFRQRHPVLYTIAMAGTISLLGIMFIIVLFPNSRIASLASTPESEIRFTMPYPRVNRNNYDEVSKFINKDLFDPSLIYRGSDDREFIFPFPSGAFWVNLVLDPTSDRGLSYPITVYPYAYKWSETLLQVSYPVSHRKETPTAVHDYFMPDLTFAVDEGASHRHLTHFDPLSVTLRFGANGAAWETYLVQGSPYITIKYDNTSPIIQAFSLFKNVICPREDDKYSQLMGADDSNNRRRLSFGVCASDEDHVSQIVTLHGVQFIVESQEGLNWILFSSEPIELKFDRIVKTTVVSTQKFSGVLRFAVIPSSPVLDASSAKNGSTSSGLQRLIYHAGVYPVTGDVTWAFRPADSLSNLKTAAKSITGAVGITASTAAESSTPSTSATSGRVGTITFQYSTKTFSPTTAATTPKALLMLALPHHMQGLAPGSQLSGEQFDLLFRCIKGPMRPILGSSWSYDQPLPSIGFNNGWERTSKALQNPVVRSKVFQSLKEDIELALPTKEENVYGFGKQAARLAQLVHIAYELQASSNLSGIGNHSDVADADELATFMDEAVGFLTDALDHFLTNNVADYLVFDSSLGGLVSIDGLRDSGADFGNGRYNDHHFHYGYILHACAILGKINPSFAVNYGQQIDSIYYDIAHDANFVSTKSNGAFFPGARHKIWFDGHSFASGLFPFANGKSQESSSEAVNCYYGAFLWSLVRQGAVSNPDLDISPRTDFSRLLLAMEIRGAQMYWHMRTVASDTNTRIDASSATVYSPQFSKNYMVGNLGMLDAVSSTWFGTESLYVHMINEIPVTAATELLFDKSYVIQEYYNVLAPLGEVEMAWKGYLVCNHAIVDTMSAWNEAQALFSPQLDSGLSKSQVLYFVATRPDFNLSSFPRNATISMADSSTVEQRNSSSCSHHKTCFLAKLTGLCCPTPEGLMLDCCNAR